MPAETAEQGEQKKHIGGMAEMLCREAEAAHGFGRVTVRMDFHEHWPRQVEVVERRPVYRIGTRRVPLR
jgi:hypothetical protein